jgi:hypothetical protein
MTTPVENPQPPAVPTQTQHHDYVVEWLKNHLHLIPNIHELAADADKARRVIPLVEAFLPKILAAANELDPATAGQIAPLVEEATTILSVLAAL